MAHAAQPIRASWWRRLRSLEPALLRAVVVAVVGVLALVGVDATEVGDKVVDGWTYLFPLLALLQGWWTRGSVVPAGTVEARLDPATGVTVAGPAATVQTGKPVEVWPLSPLELVDDEDEGDDPLPPAA